MNCKFCDDFTGICFNAECPMRGDCCPVPDTEGVCKFECREEESYELTPKSCAIAGLVAAGLIRSENAAAVDIFWAEFTLLMQKFGYIQEVP